MKPIRKALAVCLVALLLCMAACADTPRRDEAPQTDSLTVEENPIDVFFQEGGYFEYATTSAMSLIGATYRDAWHDELNNFAQTWKDAVKDPADVALIDQFEQAVEQQASLIYELDLLRFDVDGVPREERRGLTGSEFNPRAAHDEAGIYKDGFYRLLYARYPYDRNYVFFFDRAATEKKLSEMQLVK